MRRAAKRDGNQKAIRDALKRLGIWVWETVEVGGGFPDMLVWSRQRGFVLLEVKNPNSERGRRDIRGQRTGETQNRQAAFRAVCPGPVHVVTSVEEALAAVGLKEAA